MNQNFVHLRSADMKYADIYKEYLKYVCKCHHISYIEQSKHLNYKLSGNNVFRACSHSFSLQQYFQLSQN